MLNRTAQLFDVMLKYVLKEASSPAFVRFMNGLFGKRYKPSSKVVFLPSESVSVQKGKLKKIISDIPLSINGDSYLIEAQITDDLDIALRMFQYGFANAKTNKVVSKDGSLIELVLPDPIIVYFESGSKTPDVVTLKIKYPRGEFNYEIPTFKVLEKHISEFEKKNLDLLLPFYLLKFRRELRKKNTGSEKRKEIARQMKALISEIDRILKKHRKENLISHEDVSLLVSEMSRMHDELYGSYKEFKEVKMTLLQKVKTRHKEFEMRGEKRGETRGIKLGKERGIKLGEARGEKRGIKQGALKVLELVEQGYKPAEIKKMILT